MSAHPIRILIATGLITAALTGDAGEGPIVCVISGGNIDLAKFASLVAAGP